MTVHLAHIPDYWERLDGRTGGGDRFEARGRPPGAGQDRPMMVAAAALGLVIGLVIGGLGGGGGVLTVPVPVSYTHLTLPTTPYV